MGERMAALEGLLLEKTASAKAVLNRALGSWPPIALPAERGHPQSHGTGGLPVHHQLLESTQTHAH